MTDEEYRQLEEADANLNEHGCSAEVGELAPRTRIQLAACGKILRQYAEERLLKFAGIDAADIDAAD